MDEKALDAVWEEILQDSTRCNRCGAEIEDVGDMTGYKMCGWCEHVTYKSIDN